MSTLTPVYLSVSLIIGHFADLIGSIVLQIPDLINSDVIFEMIVCSLTDGK